MRIRSARIRNAMHCGLKDNSADADRLYAGDLNVAAVGDDIMLELETVASDREGVDGEERQEAAESGEDVHSRIVVVAEGIDIKSLKSECANRNGFVVALEESIEGEIVERKALEGRESREDGRKKPRPQGRDIKGRG